MKLVELLARELDVWPEGVAQLTQSRVDDEIYDAGDDGDAQICLRPNQYLSKFHDEGGYPAVTRADWQAERERIAGGWIAWGGGECPVAHRTAVDVRFRDGEEASNCKALTCESDHKRLCAQDWDHSGSSGDIIAYRLHKPEQQQPQQEQHEMTPAHTEYNPIHTRDRILEIDRTTEALEGERVQLVQRLADEGFVLIQVVAQSEPAEWKVGDLLEITGEEEGHEFDIGQIVVIARIDKDDEVVPYYCKPSVGDGEPWFVNSNEAKFHSRPTE